MESYIERLNKIVDNSYEILCSKIAGGQISIVNEASLQLQFGVILTQLGKLYEFSPEDRFSISLESVQEIKETTKSKRGSARCDIMLYFSNNTTTISLAIELKCFLKSKNAETITSNRYSVYKDLENLENYDSNGGYEVVYTNNENYSNPDSKSKIPFGDKMKIKKILDDKHPIELRNEYELHWDSFENKHFFLKVKVEK
ncbi:MAG: hypothetical protein ACI3ZZ_01940 [Candidatus Aphodosoma sp.]